MPSTTNTLANTPPLPRVQKKTFHDGAGFISTEMITQGFYLKTPGRDTGLTQAYQNTYSRNEMWDSA